MAEASLASPLFEQNTSAKQVKSSRRVRRQDDKKNTLYDCGENSIASHCANMHQSYSQYNVYHCTIAHHTDTGRDP